MIVLAFIMLLSVSCADGITGGGPDVPDREPGELPESSLTVKGKVDFPQIGFEKGTTERGVSKVSKSC